MSILCGQMKPNAAVHSGQNSPKQSHLSILRAKRAKSLTEKLFYCRKIWHFSLRKYLTIIYYRSTEFLGLTKFHLNSV